MEERIKKILKLIPNGNGKLLDIGCHDGSITKYFVQKGYDVEAIDVSDKLSQKLKKKIKFKKADITKILPYKENYFDIVFCGEVLEHILDPIILLKEIKRILKKKSKLILTIPNISSFRNAILILIGSFPAYASRYNSNHVRDFNKKDIIAILSRVGFKKIKINGDKISLPIWKMVSIKIPPIFLTYSDYLIVKAIK